MFQVYLVAGGRTTNEDGSEGVKLDSTELFIGGKWATVGPLPVAVTGVRGVTLDNTVLMAGLICPIYITIFSYHYCRRLWPLGIRKNE